MQLGSALSGCQLPTRADITNRWVDGSPLHRSTHVAQILEGYDTGPIVSTQHLKGRKVAETYEVKVTVGDATVEVKGPKDGVVAIVKALSEMLSTGRLRAAAALTSGEAAPGRPPPPRRVDARSFFQEKAPSSQIEAVAVAAYYLAELAPQEAREDTVTSVRVRDVFRQAKYPLPKRLAQVLVNAQQTGYIDRVASGEYKLSPVGWNLVEHTLGA